MDFQQSDKNIPLVVDLDGTLINTDLLYEGIILLIKKNPVYILNCILWILKGKVYFKTKIFEIIDLNYALLPFNLELLNFLQMEYNKGRKLILATASLKSCAEEIARIFPIFTEVYGTEHTNLKGENKLELLNAKYGKSNFDYIGNSRADIKIFASSRCSYLVNPSKSIERKTREVSELKYIWRYSRFTLITFFKAIRVYQWIKNLLIFVPLITSHSFYSVNLILDDLMAFLSFSLIASSGYLINDLLDLTSDRLHPRKRNRPIASGELSIWSACIIIFILLVVGLYFASKLNPSFLVILLLYLLLSVSYSIYIKRFALYDVFILALLYSIRIFAGGLVIDVSLSFWLIAFSTFIFLSLAMIKRYSELTQTNNGTGLINRSRQYSIEDINILQIMGIVSGFMSVIVFSLYINSNEVVKLYTKPNILGTISLLFLFWISRIWLIASRGKMTDDPIVFAIKDMTSYFIFVFVFTIIVISI